MHAPGGEGKSPDYVGGVEGEFWDAFHCPLRDERAYYECVRGGGVEEVEDLDLHQVLEVLLVLHVVGGCDSVENAYDHDACDGQIEEEEDVSDLERLRDGVGFQLHHDILLLVAVYG
eukprot:CAMPEP_0173321246 /NCGR_PEP_ID=MMETSP1143-20121109/29302_1 /TAXON_ID=483371 /ORGANISM="non described non described, Strain CCMP2298" /LENGTH=116 /DNA_ID=CAMNT_0014264973 /DNA_START=294 /DNA_END=644 /DNA_ORIENTATION=-